MLLLACDGGRWQQCDTLSLRDSINGTWLPAPQVGAEAERSDAMRHWLKTVYAKEADRRKSWKLDYFARCDEAAQAQKVVRPLWVWRGQPEVPRMRPAALCSSLRSLPAGTSGAGVLFIGDSLSQAASTTLAGLMDAQLSFRRIAAPGQNELGLRWFDMCAGCPDGAERCAHPHPPLWLAFLRNDALSLLHSNSRMNGDGYHHCYNFAGSNVCEPFDIPAFLAKFRVIVVSQGAHFLPRASHFLHHMQRAADALERHANGSLVLWVDAMPGIAGCEQWMLGAPFASLEEAEAGVKATPWYHGASFSERNRIARGIFKAKGAVLVDAYVPTVLRRDAHVSASDCLHYCVPGPSFLWVDMIAQRIEQAAACAAQHG